MSQQPLIIVVGGDELALRVCEELCSTRGHDVVLLWEADNALAERAKAFGAAFVGLPPNEYESLRTVGVMHATSIMPVSDDDRLNLQVALKARDLNPKIRVVVRQFNRTLGRKIEQNLPDCSAVSASSHAAATYAGAAVDAGCFFAVQFPDFDGELLGFSDRTAADFRLADTTVAEAERKIGARIISVGGQIAFEMHHRLDPQERVIAFGPMTALRDSWPKPKKAPFKFALSMRFKADRAEFVRALRRVEPVLVKIFCVGLAVYVLASLFFMFALKLDVTRSLYFVMTTMSTTGYGDISPGGTRGAPALSYYAAMFIMVAGLAISGVFIAAMSSALSRAQITALRGLRRLRENDHVVVCGAGNVGTRVIDFLLRMKQKVVVVEQNPDSLLIERARNRQIDLLTGDASNDVTLNFCDLPHARSLVALTQSDTANLEVGLGARAKCPELSVVLRVMDPAFAHSIGRQFAITRSFSTTELTAPAIAGLSRFPGTRGRISFDNEDYTVGERLQGAIPAPPPANFCIPLYVLREGNLVPLHDFAEMKPYDRLLFIVPLSQFRTTAGHGEEEVRESGAQLAASIHPV
ncbi:MAG: NAD-binding protein [Candidatus Eremiobacteraeota bacterium]|nr:NAD-binding protein [Candidatus Eremiobacteraeota bacterium]